MFTSIKSFKQKLRLKSRPYLNKLGQDGEFFMVLVGAVAFLKIGFYRMSIDNDYDFHVKDMAMAAPVALFAGAGMSTGLLPKGLVVFITLVVLCIPFPFDGVGDGEV